MAASTVRANPVGLRSRLRRFCKVWCSRQRSGQLLEHPRTQVQQPPWQQKIGRQHCWSRICRQDASCAYLHFPPSLQCDYERKEGAIDMLLHRAEKAKRA
jgi:hypothetical protein